ncbi:hypothetical protein B0H10DRAFT_2067642 [Mycena sp. CBHHK59/15]|nr:hypothetical protein B0H10DRAFT_2067642 [Mycena sp. CBHHK59/15]
MGQTLLISYAHDNFDINFPNVVPTIEKSTDTLTHMTSGGLIYMEHGVEPGRASGGRRHRDVQPDA